MNITKRRHADYPKSPAEGPCDRCGQTVYLSGFTNTCECGTDYNMSGQRLAPRSQWGEETGEHPTDLANPSYYEGEW
jgi:hypothetical protein